MALAGDPEPPTEESAYVDGPVTGIDCTGESGRSLSTSGGILLVQHGEHVTLSLGQLVLGTGATTASMTSIDLDPTGTPLRAGNRAVNVARLLQSLGTDPHLVAGITVTEAHRDAASQFAGRIDFDLPPDAFGYDASVRELLGALGVELRDEHPARNHLRRSAHGIKKRGDVPVPLRDGSALLADVFVPSDGRPVPAVLRLGPYGRAFGFGPLITEADRRRSERRETAWFEDHSSGAGRGSVRREPHLGRRVHVGATRLRRRRASTSAAPAAPEVPYSLSHAKRRSTTTTSSSGSRHKTGAPAQSASRPPHTGRRSSGMWRDSARRACGP